MRKIVLSMSVSLDGYVEGPGREIDWHVIDDELHQYINDRLGAMGAFLCGRVTHQLMADYWPTADAEPGNSGPTVEFAGIWRSTPKIVFSRTMDDRAEWNTTVMRRVDLDEITALKQQPGGDLALSGADLAASFRALGLVDEYRIYVHPVLIGRGKPLFAPTDAKADLRLVENRTFRSGVVMLHYRRAERSADE
ncbi:dihydrofolate reductase family protein [Streptacidiphilus albus]|uniref:dihydrofolate reductase family protein n=2 Tax=Streptacidiphilus albus TaxID=105425 RepID=UPI00054BB841|nr:dihydrofolate reductase family protein [Streptacidiphilus albus]